MQPPGVCWMNRGRLAYPLWVARALARGGPREEPKDYSKAAAVRIKNNRQDVSQVGNANSRFLAI